MYVNTLITTSEGLIFIVIILLIAIFLAIMAKQSEYIALEHRLEELDKLRRSHLHVMKEFLTLKHEFEKHRRENTNDMIVLKSKEEIRK